MIFDQPSRRRRRPSAKSAPRSMTSWVQPPDRSIPQPPVRPKPNLLPHKDRLIVGKHLSDLYPHFRDAIGPHFQED